MVTTLLELMHLLVILLPLKPRRYDSLDSDINPDDGKSDLVTISIVIN